jgi:glycosyltransferase involved in cell wall biosynthesis
MTQSSQTQKEPERPVAVRHHITVCVCTFKRPALLERLLTRLGDQATRNLFDYSVTVVDNDRGESARAAVESFARRGVLAIRYCVEPEQNIARARNKAVANAPGDFIAFIDDDEFPRPEWLVTLYEAVERFKAAGVLGPVLPYFDERPPQWVERGRFYERTRHSTGTVLPWTSTRTGNVLFRSAILTGEDTPFKPELGSGGEDRDFFKRKIEEGLTFVWCDEGVVYELVPPHRWKKSFMLRRALLRGQHYVTNASYSRLTVPVAFLAVPLYLVALPFLLVAGEHLFMKYLIKLCDHLGKCLAFAGITVVKETYVTE